MVIDAWNSTSPARTVVSVVSGGDQMSTGGHRSRMNYLVWS